MKGLWHMDRLEFEVGDSSTSMEVMLTAYS